MVAKGVIVERTGVGAIAGERQPIKRERMDATLMIGSKNKQVLFILPRKWRIVHFNLNRLPVLGKWIPYIVERGLFSHRLNTCEVYFICISPSKPFTEQASRAVTIGCFVVVLIVEYVYDIVPKIQAINRIGYFCIAETIESYSGRAGRVAGFIVEESNEEIARWTETCDMQVKCTKFWRFNLRVEDVFRGRYAGYCEWPGEC